MEELTIVDVKENLLTEMKGELKSLTIDNLIIPDENDQSLKQSKIIMNIKNYIHLYLCVFRVMLTYNFNHEF